MNPRREMLFQAALGRKILFAVLASVLEPRHWHWGSSPHNGFRPEDLVFEIGTVRYRWGIRGDFCSGIRTRLSAAGVDGRAEVVGECGLVHHDDITFATVVLGHDIDSVVVEGLLVGEVAVAAVTVDQLRVCGFHMLVEGSLVGELLRAGAATGLKEPFQPGGCLGEFGQWVLPSGLGGSGRSGGSQSMQLDRHERETGETMHTFATSRTRRRDVCSWRREVVDGWGGIEDVCLCERSYD